MAATVSGRSTNTGGAAATATCLVTFGVSAGDLLEAWIRGSANASATVAGVFDNAFGGFTLTGSPTTTVLPVTATLTANALVGLSLAITTSGGAPSNINAVRLIASNTTSSITLASALPTAPFSGDVGSIGNTWSALSTWQLDGGAGTSHGGWWHAPGALAASASSTTVTVVWGGGSTAFTLGIIGVTGGATGSTPETVGATASGNSSTPTAAALTAPGSGVLLLGVSAVVTALTFSSELDNSGGSAMTQELPSSGTSRLLVASRTEASGSYAPQATMSTSEGWSAGAIFIPDAGVSRRSMPVFRRATIFVKRRRFV